MQIVSLLILLTLIVSLTGRSAPPPPGISRSAALGVLAGMTRKDGKPSEALLSKTIPETPLPDNHPKAPVMKPEPSAVELTTRLLAHAVVRDLVCSAVIEDSAIGDRSAPANPPVARAALYDRQFGVPGHSVAGLVAKDDNAEDATMLRLAEHLRPELAPGVRRLRREDPNLFALLTQKMRERYPGDLAPIDERGKKTAGILERAFSEPKVENGRDGSAQSRILLRTFGKEEIKAWAKTYADSYLVDLVSEPSGPEVLANFVYETSADTFAERHVAASDDDGAGKGCDR